MQGTNRNTIDKTVHADLSTSPMAATASEQNQRQAVSDLIHNNLLLLSLNSLPAPRIDCELTISNPSFILAMFSCSQYGVHRSGDMHVHMEKDILPMFGHETEGGRGGDAPLLDPKFDKFF